MDSELVDTHRWNQDETKILARGRLVFGRGLMQLKASHWVEIMGGGITNYQTFLWKGKDSFFRFEWMGECWGAGNLCLGLRPS